MIFNPHNYQDRGVDWVLSKLFCALWMEMGLGKTVTTLTALSELLYDFRVKRVLIIAPLRVAKSTWPKEIAKWSHTKNIPYSVITGTPAQRTKALKSKAPVHIINYDNLVWLVKYVLAETGGRWPYDTIIVDESSWVKHQGSKRHKALNHVRPAIDRMIQLTGSPAPNGLLNLWGQIFLLDKGKRLGNTFKAMRDRWFQPVAFNEYGPTWEIIPGASRNIHKQVSDIALSLRASDYLNLPEDINVPVYIDLPMDLMEQYNHLETKMWLELGDKNIEAVNGGALTNKCRQFVNGFMYDEDRVAHPVHDLKLDALTEIVDEAEGQPLLIGYQYKHDLKQILSKFPNAVQLSDDPKQIDDWNAGKIPILLAHPQSAGHGLNMQDGGHMMVLYGIDWNLELYEQLIARLSRQGQKYPVIVYHIMARGTVDELMLMRIEDKEQDQNHLKDTVHRYQQKRYAA